MSDLKVGDVVRLKSGGPLMTVAEVATGYIKTEWFSGDVVSGKAFYRGTLEVVSEDILEHALTYHAHLLALKANSGSKPS